MQRVYNDLDMDRSVDYDAIAEVYDCRYDRSDYGPVLQLLLRFVRGSRHVLEVGCGTGYWLQALRRQGCDVVGLDPSINMLRIARRKSRQPSFIKACAEAIPCRQTFFDRVFCVNSFHHFVDKRRFLTEAHRLLRPGGGIMIVGLDPHTGLDRWWIYDYFRQVIEMNKRRYPSAGQMRNLMAAYGFVSISTAEALHMPLQISARSALETGRLAKTTTSQLSLLTDDEYDEGMRRLRADIDASEGQGRALTIGADLRLYATIGWPE
ncbi:MAG: class I SAM-dependent methyltransferase [Chloroflexota bacterium]|nr:MAG: class I SAM-dependent methyltransferase [Chloroflexota bacterium]